ncbi:efflux transporter outer membrane subunit [Acinetobacter sp. Tr-809]|uniref:efflux transporter outer membrane subunit n=1 Tax=Acinetobacter sp. Tr-809 TaxID=2608324 RepID=UPI0014232BD8|nr:efflux transporter outer membrane subunit [Acinetobacter sp. Tr-809]NIE96030.1 efflux transporter outer membrane subunit [Acinetobacter sp. Tr-809]
MKKTVFTLSMGLAVTMLLTACQSSSTFKPAVYQQPVIQSAAQYKYADLQWIEASKIAATPQPWWEMYQDPTLSTLIQQLDQDNLSIQQAQAKYRHAMALLDGQRANALPSISMGGNANQTETKNAGKSRQFGANVAVSWIPDLWGRVAKAVEGQQANLQASAADLAAIQLSQQLLAAEAYWSIRLFDAKLDVLNQTQQSDQRSVRILQQQYQAGMIARADVIQAETQLKQVGLQLLELQRSRDLQENVLAVLVGRNVADFNLNKNRYQFSTPHILTQIPSRLLAQRPDVIRSERELAFTHAQLGLAQTAWLPDLTISLDSSANSQVFHTLLQSPNTAWSIGAKALGTLFDGGKRQADIQQAQANYDEKLAAYKHSVLTGWKEVEDGLLQAGHFQQQIAAQQQLLKLSVENERVAKQRYQAGLVSYLEVATAQNLRLSAEERLLELQQLHLKNSAQLVAALGGGMNFSS